MTLILATLLALNARAGLLDWCEGWLIQQDPYEYEQTPNDILCRKLKALEVKEQWRPLTRLEASDLRVVRGEFNRRAGLAEVLGTEAPACP